MFNINDELEKIYNIAESRYKGSEICYDTLLPIIKELNYSEEEYNILKEEILVLELLY